MTEIVVQNIGELIRREAGSSLIAYSPSRLSNALIEERRITYYKVKELAECWEWLYRKSIVGAMRQWDSTEEATQQLDEIIEEFDAAMIAVAPLGSLHRKVTEQLEELAMVVRTKPKPSFFSLMSVDRFARAEKRRRSRIRKRAERVMRGLQKMREKAETPALLRRTYNRLWGEFDTVFDLDPDERERVRLLARGAIGEASRNIAARLLDPNVAEAFRVLQLEPWAKPQEMQERFTFLIKQLHPDKGGDDKTAAKINIARDTLEVYYRS